MRLAEPNRRYGQLPLSGSLPMTAYTSASPVCRRFARRHPGLISRPAFCDLARFRRNPNPRLKPPHGRVSGPQPIGAISDAVAPDLGGGGVVASRLAPGLTMLGRVAYLSRRRTTLTSWPNGVLDLFYLLYLAKLDDIVQR
jgi:hypothetical protein